MVSPPCGVPPHCRLSFTFCISKNCVFCAVVQNVTQPAILGMALGHLALVRGLGLRRSLLRTFQYFCGVRRSVHRVSLIPGSKDLHAVKGTRENSLSTICIQLVLRFAAS